MALKITKEQLQETFIQWKNEQVESVAVLEAVDAYLFGRSINEERAMQMHMANIDYHVKRGCCDGSDLTKCTFKEKKIEPPKRETIERHNFQLPE